MERVDIEAGLCRKGFKIDEKRDHNFFFYWTEEGQKTPVRTKTSKGSKYKRLDKTLVASMARQCKLTRKQFADLIECPLSRQEYERILKEDGGI